MSGFLDNLSAKAGDLLKKGKAFADTTIEKGKDKAQELKLNSQLRDTFAKLGEAFYDQAVNGADFADKDELLESVTAIKQTLSDLAEKAARVEEAAEEAAEAVEEKVEETVEKAEETLEEAFETKD